MPKAKVKRKHRHIVFRYQTVKLEITVKLQIKNIMLGSLLIYLLLNLTPEQIRAYGDAIFKIGLLLLLFILIS